MSSSQPEVKSSAFLGRRLPDMEIAQRVHGAAQAFNLQDSWHVVNLTSIVVNESGGYEWAVNINPHYHGSMDIGLAQLNSHSTRLFHQANWPNEPFVIEDLLSPVDNLFLAFSIATDAAARFKTWRADWRWWSSWGMPDKPGPARTPASLGRARKVANEYRASQGWKPL
jgi:hypothetical protein